MVRLGRAACHHGVVVSAPEGRWVTGHRRTECGAGVQGPTLDWPWGSHCFLGSGSTRRNEHVAGVLCRQVTASPSSVFPTLPSSAGVSYSVFTSSLGCHIPGHHMPHHRLKSLLVCSQGPLLPFVGPVTLNNNLPCVWVLLAVGGIRVITDSCPSSTLHNSGTLFAWARDQHSFSVEDQTGDTYDVVGHVVCAETKQSQATLERRRVTVLR